MYKTVSGMVIDNAFLAVRGLGPEQLYLKIEALNPAGSVKLKTALGLIESLEQQGRIGQETILIESSSGNLGVAISMICAERGYRFICVGDPNTSAHNIKIMRAFGAEVVIVKEKDSNGGFLGTRIAYVRDAQARDSRYLWLNQYENPANPDVHARTTARAICAEFSKVDYLFVGAGTTGTLMGCVRYFSQHRPETKIVAVDSIGSVTFGAPASKRYIPGLGSSQCPPLFERSGIAAFELISEADTIAMCRHLARSNGILVGGSTGTVAAAVHQWRNKFRPGDVVVAIAPDFGDRYLDTIYDDDWVVERFGHTPLQGLTAPAIAKVERGTTPRVSHNDEPSFHVVPGEAVRSILEDAPARFLDAVEAAYLAHHDGQTVNPDSYFLRFPSNPANRIIALPASIDSDINVSGIKWIASFPENIKAGIPRASATLILNDQKTGYPFVCLEASQISAVRTAASGVLAARWLGERGIKSRSIAFIGAGIIARNIATMFLADDWEFDRVGVYDVDQTSTNALADYLAARTGRHVNRFKELQSALEASIVVFATNVGAPYVERPLGFRPGQLVLNISLRDIAPDIICDAFNIVDDVEHCLKANTSPHLAEQILGHREFLAGTLAEVIRGDVLVDRTKPLIFSPFGLGILDLAVGKRVYDEARHKGLAISVPSFFAETRRW